MRRFTRLSLSLCLWILTPVPLSAEDHPCDSAWTSFLDGGRVTLGDDCLDTSDWGPTPPVDWEVPLRGYGQSSPLVRDGRVYITSVSGDLKQNLHVQALGLDDGQELWSWQGPSSSPTPRTPYVSKAASTPVCDEHGVIALFESGNLVALRPDGEHRWQRDLVASSGPLDVRHGLGASLEQDDDRVFVWLERKTDPRVLCLAKRDGEILWDVPGLGATSWSSPRLISVDGKEHLILSGSGRIAGLDPETGQRLWTLEGLGGNTVTTPMPAGPGRFLIGASSGRNSEARSSGPRTNGLIEIAAREDGGFEARILWSSRRATSSFGSPVAHGGRAYFVSSNGVLYGLDLEDGRELYAERTGSSVWATPIVCGTRLLLFGKDGAIKIIRSADEFQEISSHTLGESPAETTAEKQPASAEDAAEREFTKPTIYAACVVDGSLLLRRGDRLYRIRG